MNTLKLVSQYSKLLLPFMAAFYSALCAYLDKYRGWRLVASVLTTAYLLALGYIALVDWINS